MKRTSLNVSETIFNELTKISKNFKISKKEIIHKIFLHCHHNFDFNRFEYGKLTNYQKIAPNDNWKCLRIDLTETQCDIYFLYRNKFRLSLSKLLAVGFILFIKQIINELSATSKKLNEKNNLTEFLDTYTEIKAIIYILVKDTFKYFNFTEEMKP